jgi:hypothetical protein
MADACAANEELQERVSELVDAIVDDWQGNTELLSVFTEEEVYDMPFPVFSRWREGLLLLYHRKITGPEDGCTPPPEIKKDML